MEPRPPSIDVDPLLIYVSVPMFLTPVESSL